METEDYINLSRANLLALQGRQSRQTLRWQSHFSVALGGSEWVGLCVCVGQGPAARRETMCEFSGGGAVAQGREQISYMP